MIVNASCIIKTYPTDFAFGVVIEDDDDDDNVDDEVGDCKFVAATATTAFYLHSFIKRS
jgi:hypothetical protein